MNKAGAGVYPRPGFGTDRTKDLAWSVLDELANRAAMATSIRDALYEKLRQSLENGEWNTAADHLGAFVDTWPLAAMVDEACQQWAEDSDGSALAVLGRAASVVGLAKGWPTGPWGPWPIPDEAWVRQQDGAQSSPSDVEALDVVELSPEDLVRRREEICSQLVKGALAAVAVLPGDAGNGPFHLAIGECRLEGKAQWAFERYGHAGVYAPDAPTWPESLGTAPSGRAGDVLDPLCDAILLPGPVSAVGKGDIKTVGWLLWDGPYRPAAVMPAAVQVLQQLDGVRTVDEVCEIIGAPREAFDMVISDLIALGAATAEVAVEG